MPGVPIVMPSEIAMVLNSIGVPPAARMPSLTRAERAQVVGARHRLDPGRGDADDRLGERLVVVADALQLGAGRGAVRALGEDAGVVLGVQLGSRVGWGGP